MNLTVLEEGPGGSEDAGGQDATGCLARPDGMCVPSRASESATCNCVPSWGPDAGGTRLVHGGHTVGSMLGQKPRTFTML